MRFIFRLEVSEEVGTGHFFRCLALAQQLVDSAWAEEAMIIFVARSLPANFRKIIETHRFGFVALRCLPGYFCRDNEQTWFGADPSQDAFEFANILGLSDTDVVFVDNYALNSEWSDYINSQVATTVSFEDYGSQRNSTSYVIRGHVMSGLVSPRPDCDTSDYLDGKKFIVMRKDFNGLETVVRKDVSKVLIYFGGADADNFTTRAVEAVLSSEYSGPVKVVVNNAFKYFDELFRCCGHVQRIEVMTQPQNFIELMQTSSLCIGAGGVNLWERVLLGLPSITIPIVPNQASQVVSAKEHGLIFEVGPSNMHKRIIGLLNTLLYQPEILTMQSEKCLKFMDCLGSNRIITKVLSNHMKIRKAEIEDEALIHTLRNHPTVRMVSINKEEISIEEHKTWFNGVLNRDDYTLVIAEVLGNAVGVVSLLEEANRTYRVSIYLNHFNEKSRGMGKYILRAVEKMFPAESKFVATVLGENVSSQKLFEGANYKPERLEFSKGPNL